MPQELPGFYYDAEKNRYFPLRGPIPGSSSSCSPSTSYSRPLKPLNRSRSQITQETKLCRRKTMRTSKLLQGRELTGNVLAFNKERCNFIEEFQKLQASQPVVWKYQGTEKIGDGALEVVHTNIASPVGQTEVDMLITGGVNDSLSLFEVGKVGQPFDNGVKCVPDYVWPVIDKSKENNSEAPGYIWRPARASLQMSSNISSIQLPGKHLPYGIDGGLKNQRVLITTLGSEASGGSVYFLNLFEPLDFGSGARISRMMREVVSLNCTIWTADWSSNASQAVIGTNLGVALVNLEAGVVLWICRSKSDVLAQQFDQSGNIVLSGLRNGAIVMVDLREKQEGRSARLIRHRIPYSPLGRHQNYRKQWFELKGNLDPSDTIFMPSSISSLISLQSYDQYFLASSMDGSVKLYDQRMTKRGAVQSYEGHVNSHTRLQLGVDQSERFLLAGGEDCNLRLWSIKSGELLFEERFSDSVPKTVCWRTAERRTRMLDEGQTCEEYVSGQNHCSGAWVGSQEGLFYLQMP